VQASAQDIDKDPATTANPRVARMLREVADLLEQQGANPFRVNAYRRAARTVDTLGEDIGEIAARGPDALIDLPGIGRSLASAILEILRTGRWAQLERLRGAAEPEALFHAIPGVGPELAKAIHEALDVETLEGLEIAAHDGHLERVPGIGPRRADMIRAALAVMLQRRPDRAPPTAASPDVALLLDIDRAYREQAATGGLRKIAPRRFNPTGEAWLPVLHAQRDDWQFTALYSNTARAHELDRIFDWVVIYFHTDSEPEGQCTVVTETHGPLQGRRVVRGREADCRDFYDRGEETS
jgi:putative hydrolase